MVVRPRDEALLAAAMLGLVKSHGWMRVPFMVDVNQALEMLAARGFVLRGSDRPHAVAFTREFIDVVCDCEGWPRPDYDEHDETVVASVLGRAYDELMSSYAVTS